ncbi:MAG: MGMT family protein [Candidatus Zixiibacteriota bacterium]|nr:MAG: MGMT family protein [candidate division Zixibacteria bacterium]
MRDKTKDSDSFSQKVTKLIKSIPRGRVATYGQIAAYAGSPLGARQVVRILHTLSAKERLPWHRVINRKGQIALRPGQGYEMQKQLLKKEGVTFSDNDTIDLKKYIWKKQT